MCRRVLFWSPEEVQKTDMDARPTQLDTATGKVGHVDAIEAFLDARCWARNTETYRCLGVTRTGLFYLLLRGGRFGTPSRSPAEAVLVRLDLTTGIAEWARPPADTVQALESPTSRVCAAGFDLVMAHKGVAKGTFITVIAMEGCRVRCYTQYVGAVTATNIDAIERETVQRDLDSARALGLPLDVELSTTEILLACVGNGPTAPLLLCHVKALRCTTNTLFKHHYVTYPHAGVPAARYAAFPEWYHQEFRAMWADFGHAILITARGTDADGHSGTTFPTTLNFHAAHIQGTTLAIDSTSVLSIGWASDSSQRELSCVVPVNEQYAVVTHSDEEYAWLLQTHVLAPPSDTPRAGIPFTALTLSASTGNHYHLDMVLRKLPKPTPRTLHDALMLAVTSCSMPCVLAIVRAGASKASIDEALVVAVRRLRFTLHCTEDEWTRRRLRSILPGNACTLKSVRCKTEARNVVYWLLHYAGADPSAFNHAAFIEVCRTGDGQLFGSVICDHVMPTQDEVNDHIFIAAAASRNDRIFREISGRMSPRSQEVRQRALYAAAREWSQPIIRALFAQHDTNPLLDGLRFFWELVALYTDKTRLIQDMFAITGLEESIVCDLMDRAVLLHSLAHEAGDRLFDANECIGNRDPYFIEDEAVQFWDAVTSLDEGDASVYESIRFTDKPTRVGAVLGTQYA